jgi:hypothetical protein
MVFARGMAIRAIHAIAGDMGFMGKFNIVERDGPFFHTHMTKSRTGHLSLKFPRSVTLSEDRQSLFRLIVSHVEEDEGVFDVVDAIAEEDKVIIVAGFVQEVLCLLKL